MAKNHPVQKAEELKLELNNLYNEIRKNLPLGIVDKINSLDRKIIKLSSDLCSIPEGEDKKDAIKIYKEMTYDVSYRLLVTLSERAHSFHKK